MESATRDVLAGWRLVESEMRIGEGTYPLLLIDQDYVIDRLIEENADLEQRNPYFGLVWPAAIALAHELAARDDLTGKRLLDLGCGPGLLGIVAAQRGARVTFLDLMPEGIALAKRNAERCGIEAEFALADLRSPPPVPEKFGIIVASDVLYERPLVASMFEFLEHALAPDGVAILSDPNRPTAHEFVHSAKRRGFDVQERGTTISDEGRVVPIRIFELSRGPELRGTTSPVSTRR